MPLYRRIARRGFSNARFKKTYEIVNIQDIENKYKNGEEVNEISLYNKGIINKKNIIIKVLGNGDLTKKVKVKVDKISASAVKKIEKAGGEIIEKNKKEKGAE